MGTVQVSLRDSRRRIIRDEVQLTFVNQRQRTLDRRFRVTFKGRSVQLSDIPAAPEGLYQVFITPKRYREKSLFLNVPTGSPAVIDEPFFVEPSQATPVFPSYSILRSQARWSALNAVLQRSKINAQKYGGLGPLEKAGLFNLFAKMQAQVVDGEQTAIDFVEKITDIKPARLLALVKAGLLDRVRTFHQGFHAVPGTLHDFPEGWTRIDPSGSFKTHDRAGNLQLTFAENAQGAFLVDADLDDHQGVEHAFDVLKHRFTGKDTHPYDIHEILVFFQGIDPGYNLKK